MTKINIYRLGGCYCKECEHFDKDYEWCNLHKSEMFETDFCSRGELIQVDDVITTTEYDYLKIEV